MDLDLRKLSYFVAVAEHQSYVRAADELHITQPSLSRQISALEKSLGVTLFNRDRRGTALTGAGRQLLEDAVPLLAGALALERRVRAAARLSNEFTVGFMPGVPSSRLLAEFRAQHPHLTVDARYVPIVDQEPYLLDGTVDVSFVWLPLESDELRSLELFDQPRVAMVPSTSPLATRTSVDLEDLRVLHLIDDPATVPGWRGDSAPARRPIVAVEERLEAVGSGMGFCVLPAGMAAYHHRDDVAAVPINDISQATVGLAYTRHRTMPEIGDFATMAKTHLTAVSERTDTPPAR